MPRIPSLNTEKLFFIGLPFLFSAIGGLLLLLSHFIWKDGILPVAPGLFTESINVPIQLFRVGSEVFTFEMDNFLVFQNFQSLPPAAYPNLGMLFGFLIWLFFVLGLSLVSTLKRMYFIIVTGLCILIFTFSGINGLHVGGLYSNTSLIILMSGTILPMILISFFGISWSLVKRFFVLFLTTSLTLGILVNFSPIENPWLWISENITLPATLVASLFLLHLGHAVISSVTVFLIRLNQGTGIKIIWHLLVIFFLYFLLVIFTLLSLMGEVNIPFPVVPTLLLFLLAASLGYGILKLKIEQTDQFYEHPMIGKSFYWLGFAITSFTWAKADFTGNQALFEFLNHIFIYGQIAFSLLFFLYLLANFSEVINSGKEIEKVLFKPNFFAYFHMRIGATMALVILVIFADAVIGMQLSSFTTQLTADYYYQNNKKLESAILYENSWMQYRKNFKAKSAAAHLRFQLGESRDAMEHLYQNFDYGPSVQNILLLSDKLHQQDKVFEALFYLEKGLEKFPENPYLKNNLALLYSKLSRPEDAMNTLQGMKSYDDIGRANLIALVNKHRAGMLPDLEIRKDIPFQINYLAHANLRGDFAPFTLNTNELPDNFYLKTAILRNQWSNQLFSPIEKDLALIDSLIGQEQMSFEERNYRETRIIRTLQDNFINETLKYLNGTAQSFPNSAGYYHHLAAKVLAGQWDLEKAAVDLILAEEKGFENFQPFHMALLYFGNKPIEAIRIHTKFEVDFPKWMEWNEEGRLIENESVKFWAKVGQFHGMVKDELLQFLNEMESSTFQSDWAMALILHKSHILSLEEFDALKEAVLQDGEHTWTNELLDNWYQFIHQSEKSLSQDIVQWFRPELGLSRNAYWTPLVWKAFHQKEDLMEKYEILQENIQFNRDPYLWMEYIKLSRQMGLDSYATSALAEMQNWLSSLQLEKLQLENL